MFQWNIEGISSNRSIFSGRQVMVIRFQFDFFSADWAFLPRSWHCVRLDWNIERESEKELINKHKIQSSEHKQPGLSWKHISTGSKLENIDPAITGYYFIHFPIYLVFLFWQQVESGVQFDSGITPTWMQLSLIEQFNFISFDPKKSIISRKRELQIINWSLQTQVDCFYINFELIMIEILND